MVIGVVPAAGRGSRFAGSHPGGVPKLLTLVDGVPMIRRTVTSLIEGGADACVVVVSARSGTGIGAALAGLPATVVINPDPDRGMFSSIQCGVAHTGGGDWCVLLPGDMPFVRPETVAAVLSAAIRNNATSFASHDGRRGHPLVLSAALRDRILEAPPGSILSEERGKFESVPVEVSDPGVHRDVDRPGDLIMG